jgi:signal transduction histidine kinase
VLGPTGLTEDFITSGATSEQLGAIDDLPGKATLGTPSTDARAFRLGPSKDDAGSVASPQDHPPLTSLLRAPIVVRGKIYGNLYLAEKQEAPEFTAEDERAAVTLAAQAGVAIENARLFEEARTRLALQERNRLAQELHDSVSQALFSLTLHARAAQLAFEQRESIGTDRLESHLAELRQLTQAALAEMKALIFELRPEALREEGLIAALRKQADRIVARDEVRVEVIAPEVPVVLPPSMEEELYRWSQEALANAMKHAVASRIVIRIQPSEQGEPQLALEISDDGVGFDPSLSRPGHLGLTTMAERANRVGGTFEVRSAPGAGSTVRVTVPLEQEGSLSSDEHPAAESRR